jgi:hypothetical protein
MPLSRSHPHRRAAALAGCLTLASLFACSDRQPTAPAPGAAVQASGTWTSTLWSIGPAGLTYAGGVTGRATAADGGKGLALSRESVRPLPPSALDLRAQRTALQGSLLRTPELPRNARAGTPAVRMDLRGARTATRRTPDGKLVQTQVLGSTRGGGTSRVLVSVDGRPSSLTRYDHGADGRLVSSRSTVFGAGGWPRTLVATDFRGMADTKERQVSALDRMLGGTARLAGGVASLVGPAPLCAQGTCDAEAHAWMQAVEAENQAYWAMQDAQAACEASAHLVPRPDPDPCGDPLQNAINAYNQAGWAKFAAWVAWDTCQMPPPGPCDRGCPGDGGGDPPPDDDDDRDKDNEDCYWVDWYISWDDGATWEYWGSEYYCEGSEE